MTITQKTKSDPRTKSKSDLRTMTKSDLRTMTKTAKLDQRIMTEMVSQIDGPTAPFPLQDPQHGTVFPNNRRMCHPWSYSNHQELENAGVGLFSTKCYFPLKSKLGPVIYNIVKNFILFNTLAENKLHWFPSRF